jgi:hypothetical protein
LGALERFAVSEQNGKEKIFSQELVLAVIDHLPLLIIGPLLAALVGYATASQVPSQYRSSALLRIDRSSARSLEAFVTTPPVANQILSKYDEGGKTPETRAAFLFQHFRVADPEPTSDRPGDRLYRLDLEASSPQTAQSIAIDLIQAWLASTAPKSSTRNYLEAELERNKLSAAANSKLIDDLQRETTKLVAPNSLSGELATPISSLISKRDQTLASINSIDNQLKGVTADVIIVAPHLPQDPMATRARAIALLYGIAALPAVLALVLLGRYFAPGLSPLQVLSRRFRKAR